MPSSAHRGLRPDEAATLAFLAAIWGASFLFIKVAVEEIGPVAVVAVRLLLASAAIAGWLLLRRGWTGVRRLVAGIPPVDALLLATTGSAVPFLLIAWAETDITSSLAGILNAATPLFTAALAVHLGTADRLRGWRTTGLVLGFGGVALVAGGDLRGSAPAIGAMLLAALLYAVSAHIARRRFATFEPQAVALIQAVVGAAVVAPLAMAVERPEAVPSAAAVASLLALSLGGTALAYFLYYSLVSTAGPQHAVAVTYLAPAAAVVYGAVLLGERVRATALVGMGVILAGQAVISTPGRRASRAADGRGADEMMPDAAA